MKSLERHLAVPVRAPWSPNGRPVLSRVGRPARLTGLPARGAATLGGEAIPMDGGPAGRYSTGVRRPAAVLGPLAGAAPDGLQCRVRGSRVRRAAGAASGSRKPVGPGRAYP